MVKKLNESGSTSFGGSPDNANASFFSPTGTLGQFMSRFFANKAKPYIANQEEENIPIPKEPLAGDTFTDVDVNKIRTARQDSIPGSPTLIRTVIQPEKERTRKDRYKQLEFMDEYPEISSAFDVYADNSIQKGINGKNWVIKTKHPVIKKEVEKFYQTINLEEFQWDIFRNICKYGDCFVENIVNEKVPKLGIQRLKVLNPNYILRLENKYGYLTGFVQEIPQNDGFKEFGSQSELLDKTQNIALDKNQITHFRLATSDPKYYPYGKSVGSSVLKTFKSLRLMEDAMLVYRLSRAPEKRVFYVNTANLPTNKVDVFMQKMKNSLRKDKMWNSSTNTVDERYNPLAVDEDLFIPHRGDKETRVEILPGGQNLNAIDDVKYFLDKILAGMKVPRDYIVESKDKGAERKANLSQLDAKFANVIIRVQQQFCEGLQSLTRKHLKLRGMPQHLINELRIEMPDPSDIYVKRKLEIDEARARVVAAVLGTGLFSKEYVYKEYYDLDDIEIENIKQQLKQDMEEQAEMGMQGQVDPLTGQPMGAGQPPMGGGEEGGPPGAEGAAPNVGGRSGIIAQKQPGSAGADAPANEAIDYLSKKLITEKDVKRLKVLKRIQEKAKSKNLTV
jgi:hypothetical protein